MSVLIAATRTVVVVVARIVETMIIAKDAVPSFDLNQTIADFKSTFVDI
jgi:hypothetical protein